MRDMPVTVLDRLLAEQWVRELKGDFPFTEKRHRIAFPEPTNEIERLAQQLHTDELHWLDGREALLQLYLDEGRTEEAAVVARMAAQAYPTDHAPNFSAGKLLMQLSQFARARRYLDRSFAAKPDHAPTLAALIETNFALEDRQQAQRHLENLKQLAPRHPLLQRIERQRARRRARGPAGARSAPRELPTESSSGS
jgi:predicted Zn-dependent protease